MVEPVSDSMLIVYDGPDEAERALVHAGKLLCVRRAYTLTAWESLQRVAARTAGAPGMMQPDWDATTEDGDLAHDEAAHTCREDVQIATEVGSVTEPYLVETETAVQSAIVDVACGLDAGVIIFGTRGVTDLRGLFTALISGTLLKNAGRSVLVVPGEKE